MNVGVVGLGLLGYNISARLLSKGYETNIYNRTVSKSNSLRDRGAKVFNTARDLANHSDFVIICVTNYEAVNDICFSDTGILYTNNPELIIGDFSTISPKQSSVCSQKFFEHHLSMLSIPVMGGPSAALDGKLIPIVSGNEDSFRKIKPILENLGKPIFYVGNREGSASAIKLALNLNIGLLAAALTEGLVLSEGFDVDPSLYLEILNSTYFRTGMSQNKGPRMIKDDFEPSFYLKNMKKDLMLAMESAQDKGITLPVTGTVLQLFNNAIKFGLENYDYTAIYKLMKKLNGLE